MIGEHLKTFLTSYFGGVGCIATQIGIEWPDMSTSAFSVLCTDIPEGSHVKG